MTIFIWSDKFNVGVEKVDRQHKKLVDIINQLNECLTIGGNSRDLIGILNDLIEYSQYHFDSEENFMQQIHYDADKFEAHKIEHRKFLQEMKSVQTECRHDSEQVTDELLDFLVNWLANHILVDDMEFASQVASRDQKTASVNKNVDILKNNLYGALRESESRFKELSDSLPAYIWISNEKGQRIFYNRLWRRLSGLKMEELQKNWLTLIADEDRENLQNEYLQHNEKKTFQVEYRVKDKSGKLFWLLETVAPRIRKNGQLAGFMGCAIDISAQKQIEQNLELAVQARTMKLQEAQGQLVQSEKMASIGQLAAGVAHEINNPLGYINSNLNTLQQYLTDLARVTDMAKRLAEALPADNPLATEFAELKKELDLDFMQDDLQDLVQESIEGATRAKKIVQDLRNFSRINTQEREMFDIEKGIDATLNIVRNELKYKAEIHKEYGGLQPYECIGSQLNQIFMNLMVNAAHAIEEFGKITLRTGYKGDEALWVEVEDTGKGIPEELKSKIFDPFFTTKPVGEGTGLGLSLTYKIIKDHGGEIELDSVPGKGTRFRIYFPLKR
jgi:two-component system, NtrC family, sensor kinase